MPLLDILDARHGLGNLRCSRLSGSLRRLLPGDGLYFLVINLNYLFDAVALSQ